MNTLAFSFNFLSISNITRKRTLIPVQNMTLFNIITENKVTATAESKTCHMHSPQT